MKTLIINYDGNLDIDRVLGQKQIDIRYMESDEDFKDSKLIKEAFDDYEDVEICECDNCEECDYFAEEFEYEFVKSLVKKIKNSDKVLAIEILSEQLSNAYNDGRIDILDSFESITKALRD